MEVLIVVGIIVLGVVAVYFVVRKNKSTKDSTPNSGGSNEYDDSKTDNEMKR